MYSVMPDPLVDRSIDRSVGPSVRRSTFSLSFALSPSFLSIHSITYSVVSLCQMPTTTEQISVLRLSNTLCRPTIYCERQVEDGEPYQI